jgi:hypothetical protein
MKSKLSVFIVIAIAATMHISRAMAQDSQADCNLNTQSEINDCEAQNIKKANIELEQVNSKVLKILEANVEAAKKSGIKTDERIAELALRDMRLSQQRWRESRDGYCYAYGTATIGLGDSWQASIDGCETELTKKQIQQLSHDFLNANATAYGSGK